MRWIGGIGIGIGLAILTNEKEWSVFLGIFLFGMGLETWGDSKYKKKDWRDLND